MEDNTFGILAVAIIGLLFFVGIGSTVASFFFDPKESVSFKQINHTRYSSRITSPEYIEYADDDQPASVIIEQNNIPTFDFD